jgi:hypothetical protein
MATKISDEERLRKKRDELARAEKEIALRVELKKAKEFQKKASEALKNLRNKRGGKSK